ncbi:MAG: pirin family protein [Proteobacteria bacterium]|nr:pirin family protein [Pseudomonadota bacterium]
MLDLRPFASLGRFENDWLTARHHFSFSDYHDAQRMGWGPLRVWNDDTIKAQSGFPPHGHADMEIITYVRKGAISHGDSQGNRGRTAAGEVQVMSAGRGIRHSEMNLEDEDTQLFQIWIMPNARGLAPRWEARTFPSADGLVPLASGRGVPSVLEIAQDATLFAGHLKAGARLSHDLKGRLGYLVPTVGALQVEDLTVGARDGLAVGALDTLTLTAAQDTVFVLADLPR